MTKKITNKDFIERRIIELTIAGKSKHRIGNELGLGHRFVEKTLAKPEVQKTLNDCLGEISIELAEVLPELTKQSLQTLLDVQRSKSAERNTQVLAAKTGLAAVLRLNEIALKLQSRNSNDNRSN